MEFETANREYLCKIISQIDNLENDLVTFNAEKTESINKNKTEIKNLEYKKLNYKLHDKRYNYEELIEEEPEKLNLKPSINKKYIAVNNFTPSIKTFYEDKFPKNMRKFNDKDFEIKAEDLEDYTNYDNNDGDNLNDLYMAEYF